jgi:amino-acid N-acetyltransferase
MQRKQKHPVANQVQDVVKEIRSPFMTTNNIIISTAIPAQREAIIQLLESARLPVADLPSDLSHFLVAISRNKVVGVIGLEIYGNCGLLRSLVIDHEYRNQHIAEKLIMHLEQHSKQLQLSTIYLLTETAPIYFSKKGFQTIQRDEVPSELQQSSEFSHVCPASAIVMKKKCHQ